MGLLFSCAGVRPDNLGIKDGRLAPCPSSPNCVSTFENDEEHGVEAISYESDTGEIKRKIIKAISEDSNAEIIEEKDDYVYAEYTSALLGFVDDVEFYILEEPKLVHFRSASRKGHSDLGVNRKRYERLRERIESRK